MGQGSKDSVRKTARGVQFPGRAVQWMFAVAQPAHKVSSFSLCKHLIPLLPASCQPARVGWELGTNVEPFQQGEMGAMGAQCSAEGAGGWHALKAAQLPVQVQCLLQGRKTT